MSRSIRACWQFRAIRYSLMAIGLGLVWLTETAVVAYYSRPSETQLTQGRFIVVKRYLLRSDARIATYPTSTVCRVCIATSVCTA